MIPEKVLTYIGGPAVVYGEEQSIQAGKHAAEAATSSVSGAGKEAGASARHSGEAIAKADQTQKKKKEQDDEKNAGKPSLEQKDND